MHLFSSYFLKKGRARPFSFALAIAACCIFSALGFLSYGSRADAAATLQTLRPTSNNLGLIALWSLDGPDVTDKIYDRSGQGNHAGLIGAATSTAKTTGKIGQALQLDGVDDYLEVPDIIEGLGAMTAVAWVKASDLTGNRLVVFNQAGAGRDPLVLEFAQGSGGNDYKYRCNLDNGTDTPTSESAGQYIDTNWHHVACVYDGSQLLIYVDGVSVDSTPGVMTGTLVSTANNFIIGTTGANTWAGQLDDIRIYNRALSAAEMKRLYASGGSKQQASQNNGLRDGLVGIWSFDGADITDKVYDRSGQGNHAGLTGAATSSAKVIGKIGQGVQFDGVDDKINAADSASLDNSSAMTYSVWVNPSILDGTSRGILTKRAGSGTANSYGIFFFTGNNIYVDIDGTGDRFATNKSFSTGRWYHVAVVYDGSLSAGSRVKVYVDGVLDTTAAETSTSIPDNNSGLAMGVLTGTAGTNFGGTMDDVRIYNRALSASEIRRLYDIGGSKQQASQNSSLRDGLVGIWSFDGADITDKVYDRSGNGSNGTLIGTATSSAKVIGRIGQALQFDGVDDAVSIPNTSAINLTTVGSVSAWINMDTWKEANVVEKAGAGGYMIWTSPSQANKIIFGRQNLTAAQVSTAAAFNTQTNKWIHVLGTYDAVTYKVYINGVFSNSRASVTGFNNSGTLTVGKGTDGAFDGKIDDVRVYNRALSAAEAKRLYNMGR